MFEATVPRAFDKVARECERRGLLVKKELRLKKPAGARHWHLGLPGLPGVLELTDLGDETSIKVAGNRDGGWATTFARELAAEKPVPPRRSSRRG